MEMNRFRTALGGFHRGDVANYIEKSAREFNTALRQLKDENANLTAERDAAKKALEEVKTQLEAVLDGKELPTVPEGDPETLELAAYRRAEAAERNAAARIRRQTEKMDGILDGVSAEFSTAKQDVEELAKKLAEVLDALETRFQKTAEDMEALKKDTDE